MGNKKSFLILTMMTMMKMVTPILHFCKDFAISMSWVTLLWVFLPWKVWWYRENARGRRISGIDGDEDWNEQCVSKSRQHLILVWLMDRHSLDGRHSTVDRSKDGLLLLLKKKKKKKKKKKQTNRKKNDGSENLHEVTDSSVPFFSILNHHRQERLLIVRELAFVLQFRPPGRLANEW